MTLREITYDLKMKVRKNRLSDDTRLSNRLIQFWVHNKRYEWLKKRENKLQGHDQQLVQNLSPMETQIIDTSLDPINLPVGFSIIRSKKKIPKTIYFHELDDGIQRVGSLDQLQNRITYIDYEDATVYGNSKYNYKEVFSFRLNGYMYLFSRDQVLKTLSYINVRGIFANPMDLVNYKDQNGDPIFSIDHEYPIHEDIWEYIKNELYQTNIQGLIETPMDTTNDANEQNVES